MMTRELFVGIISLVSLFFCLSSCLQPLSKRYFQVIPHSPQYLLQSPNAQRTPFTELLRAYNGFEAGRGWIDLKSLMELRIENAYYEPGASRSGLTGFLGTEVARYAVLAHGLDLLSVQPMKNRPHNDIPVQLLISSTAKSFHYYRLYYEVVFTQGHQSHGSVLLGAESQKKLEDLSAEMTHPDTVCSQPNHYCTVFPDACSVSVEVKIVVNGKATSVSWGSTLGSIVQQPHHLELKRLDTRQLKPVRMDLKDSKVLLLPLLPGDQIAWN